MEKKSFKTIVKEITQMQEFVVIATFLAAVIICTIINPVFIKPLNLASITKMMSIWGLLAVGETFIIMTGEIDISIGSMSACGAMVFAYLIANMNIPPFPAFLLLLVAMVLLSLVNGLCIVKLKMPAFVVTIAMTYMCKGFGRAITNAHPISIYTVENAQNFIKFGQAEVLGFSWGFIVFVAVIIITAIILKSTIFGAQVTATGDSLMASRIAGVDTDKIKILTYVISGIMVALVAMFMVGRETTANPSTGDGWEMQVIAACAIGGISLDGGSGSMIGTFFGVAFMAAISNALNLFAVNANWQTIVVGIVILFAVVLDITRKNKKFGRK